MVSRKWFQHKWFGKTGEVLIAVKELIPFVVAAGKGRLSVSIVTMKG